MGIFSRENWHSGLTYKQTCDQCKETFTYTDYELGFRPWFADGFVYCQNCKKPLRHNESYAIKEKKIDNQDSAVEEKLNKYESIKEEKKTVSENNTKENMMYCQYCGKRIQRDAKFCSNCGRNISMISKQKNQIYGDISIDKEIQEDKKNEFEKKEPQKSKERNFYDGQVHKCPNCGEIIDAFQIKCSSCGYELRGVNSNLTIKELAEKISSSKNKDEKNELISNFYIPNTKEDIYEFFILAVSNIEAGDECLEAWYAKLEQAYHKANLLLANTTQFLYLDGLYQKVISQKNSKLKKNFLKKRSKVILYSIICTIGLFMMVLGIILAELEDESFYALMVVGMMIGMSPIFIQIILNDKKNTK